MMRQVKIALTGLAIAGVVVGGALRWHSSPSRIEAYALELYLGGKSRQAYDQLAELSGRLPSEQLLLFQGYTLRGSDLLARSNQRLLEGIETIEDQKGRRTPAQRRLLLELGLNLALNGYQNHDKIAFEKGMTTAEEAEPKNPWVLVFHALQAERQGQFQLASELAVSAGKRTSLSPWMQKAFSDVVPSYWEPFVRARALIEQGKTVAARELMSQVQGREETTRQALKVLSALIQIREGQARPLAASRPYFELAYANLKELAPHSSVFAPDYADVALAFSRQGQACIREGLIDQTDFYVGVLSGWHDKESLAPLAKGYIQWLASQELSGEPMPSLAADHKLDALVRSPEWEEVLHQCLLSQLMESMDKQRWEAVQQFWTMTVSSTQSAPSWIDKIEQTVESYIDKRMKGLLSQASGASKPEELESSFRDLSQLLPLLAQMESDPTRYQSFLMRLVDQSATLIDATKVSPLSGEVFNLLVHATSAPKPEQLLVAIRERITRRFYMARSAQDIPALVQLFDIAAAVGVDAIPSHSAEEIANLLADARYLLESDQIPLAQGQLRWILKLDENNAQARLLLGSSFFASGDFPQACKLLETVSHPSSDLRQLLALAYLRSGRGQEALTLLGEFEQEGVALSDRLLLESSLYLASQKQWTRAQEQLALIKNSTPDVWLYRLCCAYRLGEGVGVWKSFQELPDSFKASRQVAALALRCIDQFELWGIADEVMEKALQGQEGQSVLSKSAQEFLDKRFESYELDLSLAAAHYLQTARQDPTRALGILKNRDQVDWRLQSERAMALLQLGMASQARAELERALPLELDEAHLPYWMLSAQTLRAAGEYEGCEQLLEQIEKKLGVSQKTHLERAQLYGQTLRLRAAIEHFEASLDDQSPLELRLLYVEALVKAGQFPKAKEQALVIAQQDHSAWALWTMAMLLYPLQVESGPIPPLPTRNLFDLLKPEQKGAVLQHLVARGELERAKGWACSADQELQAGFEGKLARMQLALLSDQRDQAQQLLHEMVSFESRSLDQTLRLIGWLEQLGQEAGLEQIGSSLELNREGRGGSDQLQTPSTRDRIVAYAASLASWRLRLHTEGALDEAANQQLERIRTISQRMRSDRGPLHFFYLSAGASQVGGELSSAERDLTTCLEECPGWIDPYLCLVDLLREKRAWELAAQTVDRALVYHPDQPWLLLERAQGTFEKLVCQEKDTLSLKETEPLFIPLKEQLTICAGKAPYLAQAKLLLGRISIHQQNWLEAYNYLTAANALKQGDRDTLCLLTATLQERMRSEGERLEWQRQLDEIQSEMGAQSI